MADIQNPHKLSIPEQEDTLQGPDGKDLCHYALDILDSDFALPDEIAGECKDCPDAPGARHLSLEEEKRLSLEAEEEEEYFDDLNDPEHQHHSLVPAPEDKVYHGLPLIQKQYRTDYPDELHLRRLCAPKFPGKRKTVDNYKSQPIANFTPVGSNERLGLGFDDGQGGDPNIEIQKRLSSLGAKQCQATVRELPPIVSVSDEVVIDYLEKNNIQMMLEYFLGMCILNTPEDPFHYISELASKLMLGRGDPKAFDDIPRLLSKDHVEAMFRLYDRIGSGFITMHQYTNAMEAMGIVKCNRSPAGGEQDEITAETFVTEANLAITDLMRSFLFKKEHTDEECQ